MKVKNDIYKIIKQFQEGLPSIKVGIMGEKVSRTGGTGKERPNNAMIGLFHEFGTKNKDGSQRMPMRSWLRAPLMDNMGKAINNLKEQKKLDIKLLAHQIGASALGIIQEGFTNNGYGEWEPTKTGKGIKPKTGNILVDTQQFRDSITFRVD